MWTAVEKQNYLYLIKRTEEQAMTKKFSSEIIWGIIAPERGKLSNLAYWMWSSNKKAENPEHYQPFTCWGTVWVIVHQNHVCEECQECHIGGLKKQRQEAVGTWHTLVS